MLSICFNFSKFVGHEITDYGDVCDVAVEENEPWYNAKNPKSVGQTSGNVCRTVLKSMQENNLTINLGGDHAMAFGTFQAHLQHDPDACLLWVDAHADLNMPFTTPSGNMHGMPVAMHIRDLAESVWMPSYFDWLSHRTTPKNVGYLALRDLDDDERRIIKHLGIPARSMHDIDKLGIASCLSKVMEVINPSMERTIHLSFDIDSIDPTFCPSTGTPGKSFDN